MARRKRKRPKKRPTMIVEANLSVKEISVRFGVHANTVYGWIKAKALPAYWLGRWRFVERDVQVFLEKRRNRRNDGDEENI